jgi:hypothetical protein
VVLFPGGTKLLVDLADYIGGSCGLRREQAKKEGEDDLLHACLDYEIGG